jgi:hypothetical protein
MLDYHRECNSNKVSSYNGNQSFNPCTCRGSLFSSFSTALFVGLWLRTSSQPTFVNSHDVLWLLLKAFEGYNIWSVCLILEACEQSFKACILWCPRSIINEGKAPEIAFLLNSRHASVGPHWISIWGNSTGQHQCSENTLPLGVSPASVRAPWTKKRKSKIT